VPTRAEIAARFDEIAEEFDATRTHPWPETLLFASLLPPRSRVLDLACGNGRNMAAFEERGHSVLGLDASRSLLERAAANVGALSLVRGDAVHTPLRPLSVDAVHCVAAIHHLPSEGERRQTVAEIVRVLRPRGLVLLSAWAIEQKRFEGASGQDLEVPWRRRDGTPVPRFYHLFRGGELESLAASAGLAVGRAWREGDNHVVLASKM
jgi:SAM-dependent methyltransferase